MMFSKSDLDGEWKNTPKQSSKIYLISFIITARDNYSLVLQLAWWQTLKNFTDTTFLVQYLVEKNHSNIYDSNYSKVLIISCEPNISKNSLRHVNKYLTVKLTRYFHNYENCISPILGTLWVPFLKYLSFNLTWWCELNQMESKFFA